jgi:putative oxidoreductase
MFYSLIHTSDDRIPMLARLALGIVMIPHGALALLDAQRAGAALGALPWLAIVAEVVGGTALIVGVLGRLAALAVAAHLIVAVFEKHWSIGFFMNWNGEQPGEGFEFHILAITLAIVVLIRGSGALSIDRLLTTRRDGMALG